MLLFNDHFHFKRKPSHLYTDNDSSGDDDDDDDDDVSRRGDDDSVDRFLQESSDDDSDDDGGGDDNGGGVCGHIDDGALMFYVFNDEKTFTSFLFMRFHTAYSLIRCGN